MQEIILAVFENPVLFLILTGLIIAGTYALFARNHAKAQELINSDHVKQGVRIDTLETSVSDQAVAFAEERGGLNNRIKSLERELTREKKISHVRSEQNKERIVSLETELSSIKDEQAKLIELHAQTQMERDAARDALARKELELQEVRRQVEALSRQVDALTGEIRTLRQTIEQKETQLQEIESRLGATE